MNILWLLLLLLPATSSSSQGHVFRLKEKSPEGYIVVENLGQFLGNGLPPISIDKTAQVLAIGNIETPGADFFKIDRDTGNLVVKVPPDRDAICGSTKKQSYTAIDRADNSIEIVPKQTSYGINAAFEVDDSCPVKLSIFHGPQSDPQHDVIIILLEDINDHVPNFEHVSSRDKNTRIPFEYEVHVKELRSSLGDTASELSKIRIPLPIAKDSDSGSNGIVYYRLEGADSYLFKLSALAQEGQDLNLFLIPKFVHNSYLSGEENQLSRILDRETREDYRMELVAEDGGTPPKSGRLNIRIVLDDINDSKPTFMQERYSASMSEDDPSGQAVLHFAAVDQDSDKDNKLVDFRIPQAKLDNSDDALNAISQRTAFNLFELEVDHSTLRSAYDTKNITKGKLLIRKLSTEDRVKAVKEAIAMAKSTQTLDGIERVFSFWIEAYDHGSPELSSMTLVEISIKSVNSEKPTIAIYYINKQEPDDPRLSKLGHVWGIVNENQDRIMLAQVTVTDQDAVTTAPSDDLRCVVSDDRFSLEEIPSAGSQQSSKPGIRKMFKLMSITKLDRENIAGGTQLSGQMVQDRFQFVIKCIDNFHALLPGGQKTSTAEVRVQIGDHNDNPPKFERPKYVFRVMENRPDITGSFDGGFSERFYLGSVYATDLDAGKNSQIEYKLTTNPHGALEIDPKNGSIYVVRPFDRELIPQVELQVQAVDNPKDNLGLRLTGSASVVVHVDDANDCVPQFRQSSYHFYVPENKDMLKIGQVIADDNDENEAGRVSYRLSAPGSNGLTSIGNYFQVDSQTGVIRLRRRLDREERLNYEFNVLAIDNPQASFINGDKVIDKEILKQNTGTTTVLVTVTDENDNPPQISSPRNQEEFFVPVSQLNAGTTIFNIKASDADFEDNAIIKYSIIPIGITGPAKHSNSSKNETEDKVESQVSGEFPINCDELIGTCYLNRSIPIELKLPVTYTFRVKAYDLGRSNSLNSSVIVKVNLGAEDPKSSGLIVDTGPDQNGRSRWSGRSLMVIMAAAFVLLLLFAVFLLLLLRFRGSFVQTFLFPTRRRRPRKDEGYTSAHKVETNGKNLMGEVHVSPWANYSSLESPNAKIIYSNQTVSTGSGARYMTTTMSPQLFYKNLNARGWSTTSGKTLVTFDRSLFEKEAREEDEEEEVSPGTEDQGVSSSEAFYGPTGASAAYIVKNYDPLNVPFQSPTMTLGRKAPKTKESNYAKLLTAQPNRRQLPLVNMRCASSLDDQIDAPSRPTLQNNDLAYLVNYGEGDLDPVCWYRSMYSNQHGQTDSSCAPTSGKGLLYSARRSPQVQFSQELTPISNPKLSKNVSAMEGGKASLVPFSVKRISDNAKLDAVSGRQLSLLDETQSSSNSSQGNDDSGVQITNNAESGFIQFKSGVEGSFV